MISSALVALSLLAQTPGGGALTPVVETEDAAAMRIGQMLRCPVCQGMPIGESPSQMAQDMMTRVRDMLAAGKSEQEVLDSFTESYGEWVLLDPKPEGLNLALFILPILALLLGGILIFRFVKRSSARPADPAAPTAEPAADEDPYLAAIRDEVEQ